MLLKVFRQSGVFNTKIRSWTALPDGDKTLPKFKAHFIEAYKNRRDESLQATLLTANTMQATTAAQMQAHTHPSTTTLPGLWLYCWSHGLCQHLGSDCRYPLPNHKPEATVDRPMGGCATIRFPGQRPCQAGKNRRNNRTAASMATATTSSNTTASQPSQVSSLMEE